MNIHSNIKDYSITFHDDLSFLDKYFSLSNSMVVIDKMVYEIYFGMNYPIKNFSNIIVLKIDEHIKKLESVQLLYDKAINFSAKKNMTIVSIGGGILQDITGFFASTLYRGINWIYIPTTLLSQCDSCIGSKTSLNYKNYKNLIGTFYPPNEIHITTAFLTTLKELDFYSGLGEVIKLHIMGGKKIELGLKGSLNRILVREQIYLKEAVRKSLEIKLSYISQDEFDTGRRNLLNYGHCFGHALESTSNFEIPHGQAVLIGILLANIVAKNRNILSNKRFNEIFHSLLKNSILAKLSKKYFSEDLVLNAMKKDKKRTSDLLSLIMLTDNDDLIRVNDLQNSEVIEALSNINKYIEIN
ncbi:MAG: AroB-related putative sugar phosphate phospholyase (cyclizing) [Stygiobacter sp.]